MLEKPHLSNETIISSLREGFGVHGTNVQFLPIGNDASSWAYRVFVENENSYFLKIKKSLPDPSRALIPRYLKDQGIEQVIAPYPTKKSQLWHSIEDYSLFLYPFIEGIEGMKLGLTDSQWIAYGTFLNHLHATKIPPELLTQLLRETFNLKTKWTNVLKKVRVRLKEGVFTDQVERELASFWYGKEEAIRQIVRHAEELGEFLQNQSLEFVPCHADIHTANILITPEQKMFVVDWDETLLAPRERDLMFILGIPEKERLFFKGYGEVDINWLVLAYYRYEWAVQEVADYGERVFLRDDLGETTKRDAVERFIELFQPGDVVEAAYKSSQESFQ